ncbi:hypothetical protein HZB69_01600 [Candidatus Amesbacteria bacterium]|nr:hypothetical protein [Candidatus Amesbacteria bacterium]
MVGESSKGQELVDASRLIQASIGTGDSETKEIGWKRLRNLFLGGEMQKNL